MIASAIRIGAPRQLDRCVNKSRTFVLSGDCALTMNDLFERSPKDLISKVVLEKKVSKTWFSDRTVLLGDGMFTKQRNVEYGEETMTPSPPPFPHS